MQFVIFRQNVLWISKLEAPCVTFLGLLTSTKMNRGGKFFKNLFACFNVILLDVKSYSLVYREFCKNIVNDKVRFVFKK